MLKVVLRPRAYDCSKGTCEEYTWSTTILPASEARVTLQGGTTSSSYVTRQDACRVSLHVFDDEDQHHK